MMIKLPIQILRYGVRRSRILPKRDRIMELFDITTPWVFMDALDTIGMTDRTLNAIVTTEVSNYIRRYKFDKIEIHKYKWRVSGFRKLARQKEMRGNYGRRNDYKPVKLYAATS